MTADRRAGGNWLARWLSDDSFSPRPPDLAVYRYKGMIWFLPLFGGACIATCLSILATLSPGRDLGGYVGIPIFAWAGISLGWLAVVTSAVRVRPDALIIDNMVVRHVTPWERLAGLEVETGMGLFARLDDSGVVKSASFGRNLSDAMKGHGHMRETLAQIRDDCQAARDSHPAVSPPPPHLWRLNLPWRPLLGFLVFFEAFAWITFAAHGG